MKFDKQIFFCHIPKTAGTSLRLSLEQAVGEAAVVPSQALISHHLGRYPPLHVALQELQDKPDFRLFRGHYGFWVRTYLPKKTLTIVVLRDPVERTISNIRHFLADGKMTETDALESLDQGRLPGADNLMCRYLGGTSIVAEGQELSDRFVASKTNPIDDCDALLKRAVSTCRSVNILGFTDDMPALLERISQETGLPLTLRQDNQSRYPALSLSDRQLDVIRNHNTIDLRLYETMRAERNSNKFIRLLRRTGLLGS
ncbi:hypothetical protein ACSSV1_003100 [Labrenzia sp. MBR-25]